MVQAKPTVTQEELECPFCKKGKITVTRVSEFCSVHSTFAASGKKAMMPRYHPEKIEVHSKCPECGKSKKEIKDSLEGVDTLSHEERIKRIKEQGLPTTLEY